MQNLIKIAFAVFAFLGARTAIRQRRAPINRWAYWHSAIASGVHALVAAYLLWFGVIGLMTWAWIIGIIHPQLHVRHRSHPLQNR